MTKKYSAAAVGLAFAIGVYLAYLLYLRAPALSRGVVENALGRRIRAFWFTNWGFDWLYGRAFVRPV
jgi:NADH-quinone oxidoreductase subunit L